MPRTRFTARRGGAKTPKGRPRFRCERLPAVIVPDVTLPQSLAALPDSKLEAAIEKVWNDSFVAAAGNAPLQSVRLLRRILESEMKTDLVCRRTFIAGVYRKLRERDALRFDAADAMHWAVRQVRRNGERDSDRDRPLTKEEEKVAAAAVLETRKRRVMRLRPTPNAAAAANTALSTDSKTSAAADASAPHPYGSRHSQFFAARPKYDFHSYGPASRHSRAIFQVPVIFGVCEYLTPAEWCGRVMTAHPLLYRILSNSANNQMIGSLWRRAAFETWHQSFSFATASAPALSALNRIEWSAYVRSRYPWVVYRARADAVAERAMGSQRELGDPYEWRRHFDLHPTAHDRATSIRYPPVSGASLISGVATVVPKAKPARDEHVYFETSPQMSADELALLLRVPEHTVTLRLTRQYDDSVRDPEPVVRTEFAIAGLGSLSDILRWYNKVPAFEEQLTASLRIEPEFAEHNETASLAFRSKSQSTASAPNTAASAFGGKEPRQSVQPAAAPAAPAATATVEAALDWTVPTAFKSGAAQPSEPAAAAAEGGFNFNVFGGGADTPATFSLAGAPSSANAMAASYQNGQPQFFGAASAAPAEFPFGLSTDDSARASVGGKGLPPSQSRSSVGGKGTGSRPPTGGKGAAPAAEMETAAMDFEMVDVSAGTGSAPVLVPSAYYDPNEIQTASTNWSAPPSSVTHPQTGGKFASKNPKMSARSPYTVVGLTWKSVSGEYDAEHEFEHGGTVSASMAVYVDSMPGSKPIILMAEQSPFVDPILRIDHHTFCSTGNPNDTEGDNSDGDPPLPEETKAAGDEKSVRASGVRRVYGGKGPRWLSGEPEEIRNNGFFAYFSVSGNNDSGGVPHRKMIDTLALALTGDDAPDPNDCEPAHNRPSWDDDHADRYTYDAKRHALIRTDPKPRRAVADIDPSVREYATRILHLFMAWATPELRGRYARAQYASKAPRKQPALARASS